MQIFQTYAELLEHVRQTGRQTRVLGHAPDGLPVISVRTGGDKLPAVLITAGSHATEQAGVSAAVALIEELDTAHQVHVIPTRDPIGMNGYAHALSLGLGRKPEFDSFEAVQAILRSEGEVFHDEGGRVLSLIGDYGYACGHPSAGGDPQWSFYQELLKIETQKRHLVGRVWG